MSCWTSSRFKFKSTSGSDAGEERVKASNPGKKFRILSPTFPALSSCEPDSDLKTYERIKSNIDPSVGRRFQFLKFPQRRGVLFVPIMFLLRVKSVWGICPQSFEVQVPHSPPTRFVPGNHCFDSSATLVYGQLVCLLPVGIFNLLNSFLCLIVVP